MFVALPQNVCMAYTRFVYHLGAKHLGADVSLLLWHRENDGGGSNL